MVTEPQLQTVQITLFISRDNIEKNVTKKIAWPLIDNCVNSCLTNVRFVTVSSSRILNIAKNAIDAHINLITIVFGSITV